MARTCGSPFWDRQCRIFKNGKHSRLSDRVGEYDAVHIFLFLVVGSLRRGKFEFLLYRNEHLRLDIVGSA